ncbi:MAG TPA: hypothetical protein VHA05_00950 [Candidatus Saccharimonadales bacterium]|nr:hypothetical protein [Candidatus Saccharimonadales bacterium]
MKNKAYITNNHAFRIVGAICLLLLVPLVAMQFTDQVNWTALDFMVAGILLLSAGIAYEVLARWAHNSRQKAIVGISVLVVLAVIWAQLAVDIAH